MIYNVSHVFHYTIYYIVFVAVIKPYLIINILYLSFKCSAGISVKPYFITLNLSPILHILVMIQTVSASPVCLYLYWPYIRHMKGTYIT